ncbi:MAG TPA: 2-succinyl-5-enolpyruvyl-6-hydroxy-3-cyclohexene-1-carboxylic-acid synthase [Actinomycetota bacterium]|nr:2-succinyl-5-enolpyruvyl-6-hydroxy-3-cyclohexene-1-carboxylic-acid synthase [Actinomycetota bacterium]
MDVADLNLACAWALVDGLVGGGVRHACISPGSRSTPLALALARHPTVDVHVHLDERSSAFFAAGLARATGTPVAVACTSGTAAAEFLPAVVEASQSRLPLILLTADRPPRLRGTGANQTIDQVGLYAGNVRDDLDLPVPEAAGQEAWWRQAAREALEAASGDPVGPVHVNCPFEEPLSPSLDVALPDPTGEALELPSRPAADLTVEEADRLAGLVSGARGAVVIGGWPGAASASASFWHEVLGWPVLAEPTSGARLPKHALTAGQSLIGDMGWARTHGPEIVIQLGAMPTTRATQAFVASADRLIVADRWHLDPDAERLATWRLAVDPDALTTALHDRPVEQLGVGIAITGGHSAEELDDLWARRLMPPPNGWSEAWRVADKKAREALDGYLDGLDEPFEPRIARDVAAWVPTGGTLFVGNSNPIRDLDLAMSPRSGLRVLANRGASGIDGLVSTALGVAAGSQGPTVALLGDLTFLYDLGALSWNARRGQDITFVVVSNGGGEIFSMLPQRDLPEHRDLFVTPHEADVGGLTTAAGAAHRLVERATDLEPSLESASRDGGLQIIEAVVDPERSVVWRSELREAIASALR